MMSGLNSEANNPDVEEGTRYNFGQSGSGLDSFSDKAVITKYNISIT